MRKDGFTNDKPVYEDLGEFFSTLPHPDAGPANRSLHDTSFFMQGFTSEAIRRFMERPA